MPLYRQIPYDVWAVQYTGDNVAQIQREFPFLNAHFVEGVLSVDIGTWVDVLPGDYIMWGRDHKFTIEPKHDFENRYEIKQYRTNWY